MQAEGQQLITDADQVQEVVYVSQAEPVYMTSRQSGKIIRQPFSMVVCADVLVSMLVYVSCWLQYWRYPDLPYCRHSHHQRVPSAHEGRMKGEALTLEGAGGAALAGVGEEATGALLVT